VRYALGNFKAFRVRALHKKIYLDYAATTPPAPEIIAVMVESLNNTFANPASTQHIFGEQANQKIEMARDQIAAVFNAKPHDFIFTSGATEANNLVLKSVAQRFQAHGKHIITSATEHKCVLDTCKFLETLGFQITYLKPNSEGLIDLDELENCITDDTILVSMMHVNNETGVIQNIEKMAEITNEKGIFFHVDAAQSVGKLDIDLSQIPISFLSFSAHKFYGVKGIGGLYLRNRAKLKLSPQLHGGGQEYGLRSGTLPTHQIIAMATALELVNQNRIADYDHAKMLKKHLLKNIPAFTLNGSTSCILPNIVNLSFENVSADALIIALRNDVAISSGSACNSGAVEASHVLRAMGVEDERLYGAVRLSFGRYTSLDDIDFASKRLTEEVTRLRQLACL
jgi:cysteine desulfurase